VGVVNLSQSRRLGKTLIVCSRRRAEIEALLAGCGLRLKRVRDGSMALGTVRHQAFDAAILLSTGKQMDLVETILNLRDIRPTMPVIVLIESQSSELSAKVRAILANAVPEVRVFNLSQLLAHLARSRTVNARETASSDSLSTEIGARNDPAGGKR
jgi:DNA-binding response OmpR family regulator